MQRALQQRDLGGVYVGMYSKPAFLEALGTWEGIAKEEGIDLAYRWVTYHSPLKKEHGDGIIVVRGRPSNWSRRSRR